jgi:hypothetical protein
MAHVAHVDHVDGGEEQGTDNHSFRGHKTHMARRWTFAGQLLACRDHMTHMGPSGTHVPDHLGPQNHMGHMGCRRVPWCPELGRVVQVNPGKGSAVWQSHMEGCQGQVGHMGLHARAWGCRYLSRKCPPWRNRVGPCRGQVSHVGSHVRACVCQYLPESPPLWRGLWSGKVHVGPCGG